MSFPAAGEDHPVRKYPVVKVGDVFGPRTVTKVLPRGHRGRSDERVEWRCVCGRTGKSWVFNMRDRTRCTHEKRVRNGKAVPIARRFTTGPQWPYWPVLDEAGKTVALCPTALLAQQVADALTVAQKWASPKNGGSNG